MGLMDLFRRETPQEQVRRWQRVLRGEMRAVDRQIADITRESKATEKSVKECMKRNDARSARVLATELVRTRAAVARMHASKAQMNSVILHLNENLAMHRAVGHIQKSGELMGLMNNAIKNAQVTKTMTELSKEMMKAGIMEEMVADAMDSAMGDDVEVETEEAVEQILAELAVASVAAMPAAGRALPQAATPAAEEEEEQAEDMSALQARLDAIRAA